MSAAESRWAEQIAPHPDLVERVAAGKRSLRGAAKEARRRASAERAERIREIARRVDAILDFPIEFLL